MKLLQFYSQGPTLYIKYYVLLFLKHITCMRARAKMFGYLSIEYLKTIDMIFTYLWKQGGRALREHKPPTRQLITPISLLALLLKT